MHESAQVDDRDGEQQERPQSGFGPGRSEAQGAPSAAAKTGRVEPPSDGVRASSYPRCRVSAPGRKAMRMPGATPDPAETAVLLLPNTLCENGINAARWTHRYRA